MYNFVNWTIQFDRTALYVMGYWNPKDNQIPTQNSTQNLYSGVGVQLLFFIQPLTKIHGIHHPDRSTYQALPGRNRPVYRPQRHQPGVPEGQNSPRFVGKAGQGKTTLLNIIGSLDTPTEGEVTVLEIPSPS